jgi:hypothetical protein
LESAAAAKPTFTEASGAVTVTFKAEMTIPDKPRSSKQQSRTPDAGRATFAIARTAGGAL